jgi:chromosome segregation ATPase
MIKMKRKFLEDLGLEKEMIDKIIDENSADIGKAKGELESIKEKLSTTEKELESTKKLVTERDGQLEQLKNSSGDVESLKKQIETLQNDNKAKDEAHAAEIKQLKIDAAVDTAISNAKGKNAKAIKALLDLENAELDEDGTVKGLADQIKALQTAEDSKFLFGSSTMKGAKTGESGNDDGDKGVDTSKMTYSELAAYMAEHPEAKI